MTSNTQELRSIILGQEDDVIVQKLRNYFNNETNDYKKRYGVTKILSSTKSDADKQTLQNWRDRVGEEVAEAILQESLVIGRSLDSITELSLQPNFIEKNHKDEIGYNLYRQIKKLLNKIEPIGLQLHLKSNKYPVHGYNDCLGYDKGNSNRLTMYDFKNTKQEKPKEYLHDYFLQTTIYCMMLYEMTGILVKDMCIILAVRNSSIPQIVRGKTVDYLTEAKERINTFKNQID